jgi:hypothetical protein
VENSDDDDDDDDDDDGGMFIIPRGTYTDLAPLITDLISYTFLEPISRYVGGHDVDNSVTIFTLIFNASQSEAFCEDISYSRTSPPQTLQLIYI